MTMVLDHTGERTDRGTSWSERNQALLQAEFRRLASLIEGRPAKRSLPPRLESFEAPAAIDRLTEIFSLTLFERDLLLLAAGLELDAALAMQTSVHAPLTLARAFGVLPDAHWSALTPARPLRQMRLLEVEVTRGLTAAPLRIDERVLHYLAGSNLLDQRLNLLVEAPREPEPLSPTHRILLNEAASALYGNDLRAPALLLHGNDPESQLGFAQAIAADFDRTLLVLRAEDLPSSQQELDTILLLLERELHLLPAAVLLRCQPDPLSTAARRAAERLPAPLLLASADAHVLDRPFRAFEINKPAPEEQLALWQAAFGHTGEVLGKILDPTLAELAGQFSLSPASIVSLASSRGPDADALWQGCREVARPRLDSFAQRIHTKAEWADLVLPERHTLTLRQLAGQLGKRAQVHSDWGFASISNRGLGISALFAGESGTGKTLAAEVLARELRLDLYRIDLSQVVSKYIGETEKNLRAVFDAADAGGVLLLFDEADALFGKRTEVKDSHDRYANIEVGYLLQRLESYTGVAILTTNLKSSIDRSFQRRLRFILTFPFPDAVQREAIWRRIFPPAAPVEALDYARLAQLNMAGGNIRNIAVNAAFLAANQQTPIRMAHLREAALLEAGKIERPLSPAEMKGWL